MGSSQRSESAFLRIELRARDRAEGERLVAEAYAAGAVGLEEREDAAGPTFDLYLPADRADAVVAALRAAAGSAAQVGAPQLVVAADWPELWKQHLTAIVVSPRLVVRPSCVEFAAGPDALELVIDPGQAFGTGAHASTRLALEWIDELAPGLESGARVLDVGTGSAVLALAATGLGADVAVAFDLDLVAVHEALRNVRAHAWGDRVHLFAGPLEALSGDPFDLVVANLLRSEMEPLLPGLAARTRQGGAVVLSGLLEREIPRLDPLLRHVGLFREAVRVRADESGASWAALLTRRRASGASGRADDRGSRPG